MTGLETSLISGAAGFGGIVLGAFAVWTQINDRLEKMVTLRACEECRRQCQLHEAQQRESLETRVIRALEDRIDRGLDRIEDKYDSLLKIVALQGGVPEKVRDKIIEGI